MGAETGQPDGGGGKCMLPLGRGCGTMCEVFPTPILGRWMSCLKILEVPGRAAGVEQSE